MAREHPDWAGIIATIRSQWNSKSLDVCDVIGQLALDYYEGRIDEIDATTIRRTTLRVRRQIRYIDTVVMFGRQWTSTTRATEALDPPIMVKSLDQMSSRLCGESEDASGAKAHYQVPFDESFLPLLMIKETLERHGLLDWAWACAHQEPKAERDVVAHRKLAESLGRAQINPLRGRFKWVGLVDFFFSFTRVARGQWLAVRHLSVLASVSDAFVTFAMPRFRKWGIAEISGCRKGARYRARNDVAVDRAMAVYRAVRRANGWTRADDVPVQGIDAHQLKFWLYVLASLDKVEVHFVRDTPKFRVQDEFTTLPPSSDQIAAIARPRY